MPNTPRFGWPTPVAADASNFPAQAQSLAQAIENTLGAHLDATTAHGRNNVGPIIEQAIEPTAFTFNNTSYSATANNQGLTVPVCGLNFIAPASGIVEIGVGGSIESQNNRNGVLLGWELRTGSTIGSGTIIVGASSPRALQGPQSVSDLGEARIGASRWSVVGSVNLVPAGLTPGDPYNLRTMHVISPGPATGKVFDRDITVRPWLR